MLNARVRSFMAGSDPQDKIVFIVKMKDDSNPEDFINIHDKVERRAAMNSAYREMKSPLVDALDAYADQGLRVVNPLDGTPQLIAEGPAEVWERAVDERSDLFDNPNIDLIPDDAEVVAI